MTEKTYKRHPEAMAQLKLYFNDAQIVEVTMISGFFNFWNRFTDAVEIDIESSDSVGNIQRSKTVDVEDYIKYMRDCWWNDVAYTREALGIVSIARLRMVGNRINYASYFGPCKWQSHSEVKPAKTMEKLLCPLIG